MQTRGPQWWFLYLFRHISDPVTVNVYNRTTCCEDRNLTHVVSLRSRSVINSDIFGGEQTVYGRKRRSPIVWAVSCLRHCLTFFADDDEKFWIHSLVAVCALGKGWSCWRFRRPHRRNNRRDRGRLAPNFQVGRTNNVLVSPDFLAVVSKIKKFHSKYKCSHQNAWFSIWVFKNFPGVISWDPHSLCRERGACALVLGPKPWSPSTFQPWLRPW